MRNVTLYTFTFLSALAVGSLVAHAQEYDQAVKLAGVTGAVIHAGVPEGFDAVSAADSQLEAYGFPMRPDQNDTKAYASWVRAVSGTRVVPQLVSTTRYHLPVQGKTKGTTIDNTTNSYSGNWSGYSIQKTGTPFVQVEGIWIIPSVANQTQSINGYMSEWVGIDGNCACNDLVQDGTAQQYTGGKASYYAWVEFIPENEVVLNGFAVAPGDVITAYTSVSTKSGVVYGNFYIYNANTKKASSMSLKIPPKTTFSGKSVEWIAERTSINGSFSYPMPNYAYSYMDNAYVWLNGSNTTHTYASYPNEMLTMTSSGGSSGTKLSKAYTQDGDSLWFEWLAY